MPTYQYRCTECGSELEAVQKFSDEPLRTCPDCSGRLRKVFNAVGVVFKGSGFYATDSRTKKPSAGKPKADAAPAAKTEVKAAAASSTGNTSAA